MGSVGGEKAMKRKAPGAAVVIGDPGNAASDIVALLKSSFEEVVGVAAGRPAVRRLAPGRVRLVVILGRKADGVREIDFSIFRRDFPSAKLVGLFDGVSPEQEVLLREAGTIFIGSRERFMRNAGKILSRILHSRPEKATDPCAH
jgi:hypothetical protein